MCDYSLHCVQSRPARIDDKLVITKFVGTMTRGFAAVENTSVAICLRPGTELVFERQAEYRNWLGELFPFVRSKVTGRLARFRRINAERLYVHHDALEFEDGKVVPLTRLSEGQGATILQLPPEQDLNLPKGQEHLPKLAEVSALR